jgi:hypothetical protein
MRIIGKRGRKKTYEAKLTIAGFFMMIASRGWQWRGLIPFVD